MKTIFVDTNVVLDVLLQNEGFFSDSLKIFKFAEIGVIHAYVSASCMTDIFYITRKHLGISVAREAMNRLLAIFRVVGVDGNDLKNAMSVPIEDMEDALQLWCAEKINAIALITRDIDGFAPASMAVILPTDFQP
jgi:predicted nucleic acid-binding protein